MSSKSSRSNATSFTWKTTNEDALRMIGGFCCICRAPFTALTSHELELEDKGQGITNELRRHGLTEEDFENLRWAYYIDSEAEKTIQKVTWLTDAYGGLFAKLGKTVLRVASQKAADSLYGRFVIHPACATLFFAQFDLLPLPADLDDRLREMEWKMRFNSQGDLLGIRVAGNDWIHNHPSTILASYTPRHLNCTIKMAVEVPEQARKEGIPITRDQAKSALTAYKFARPDVFDEVPSSVLSSRYAIPLSSKIKKYSYTPSPLFDLSPDAFALIFSHILTPEPRDLATKTSDKRLKASVKSFLAFPLLSRYARHLFLDMQEYQTACYELVVTKAKEASGHFSFLDVARFIPSLITYVDKISATLSPPVTFSLSQDWHHYLSNSLIDPSKSALNRARVYKVLRRMSRLFDNEKAQYRLSDERMREILGYVKERRREADKGGFTAGIAVQAEGVLAGEWFTHGGKRATQDAYLALGALKLKEEEERGLYRTPESDLTDLLAI